MTTNLSSLLLEHELSISVAESCTGGAIADRIVSSPGASQYFSGGLVTYANQAKVSLLRVEEKLISKHGAVSEEVAIAMADGIRKCFGTDIGVSTTGIAGPTGGSKEKPIGTVWIGFSSELKKFAVHKIMPLERNRFRKYFADFALEIVRQELQVYSPGNE